MHFGVEPSPSLRSASLRSPGSGTLHTSHPHVPFLNHSFWVRDLTFTGPSCPLDCWWDPTLLLWVLYSCRRGVVTIWTAVDLWHSRQNLINEKKLDAWVPSLAAHQGVNEDVSCCLSSCRLSPTAAAASCYCSTLGMRFCVGSPFCFYIHFPSILLHHLCMPPHTYATRTHSHTYTHEHIHTQISAGSFPQALFLGDCFLI